MKVAIIGGGASGAVCAIRLKQLNNDIDVTIFEKEAKLFKKLAITGSGRCNLSNANIKANHFTNQKLVGNMLDSKTIDPLEFFKGLGLFTINDSENRIYPLSMDSKTVIDLLNHELFFQKIKVNLNQEVKKIYRENNLFLVNGELFDCVVISVGSIASITNDLSFYSFFDSLGLKYQNIRPGLVGFKTKEDFSSLFGVKAKVKANLDGCISNGEIIFKEDGISGICLMDLSIYYDGSERKITIDFMPNYESSDLHNLAESLIKRDNDLKLYNLLIGSLNRKLLGYINARFENKKVKDMSYFELDEYFQLFKNFKITLSGTYSFKDAQVVTGGVLDSELKNFEAVKYPNMFITGEAIDNAGVCGGFNLWFAFKSGLIVADSINGRDK